ncbi:hypothetical protein CYLTODRAFT_370376 [Cylindrobasidium torrendii FP15055 ss-10]|uniref:Uncharacterized protein n=1 Tax=Cylindrobasidium torrendii FP15055 ss-10 TaxID=1314674 RepID=A0A0D7BMP5_9AGAR|nr:hypothetical protein CYLTODRAFT_370376 [Cylindrobasidium torrendii FP15055 ss-10]
MQHTDTSRWFDYPLDTDPLKVDVIRPELSLLSPPTSPELIDNFPLEQTQRRSPKSPSRRHRPYPSTASDSRTAMSSGAGYDTWPPRSTRPQSQNQASAGAHTYNSTSFTSTYADQPDRPTSSMSAWRGEPTSHARYSASPVNTWATPPTIPQNTMGMDFGGMNMTHLESAFPDLRGNASSSTTAAAYHGAPSFPDFQPPIFDSSMPSSTRASSTAGSSSLGSQQDTEVHMLRKRVQELERQHKRDQERIRAAEAASRSPESALSSSPGVLPVSPTFQESWRLRTEARKRQFCSLNRAGNALCAWHDSRRERRVYPPRMAPPGFLNCGCTYEEALFEESLSRHGVGSYLPGESVRMDPALRNPLLKVLQERYGYKDGDFERNARTGDWLPGQGHAYWEQQSQTSGNPRRPKDR